MFSPLSSKLSYSLTAPTRDLAPTSLLELIQLTVPAVGRNMPGSSFNRGAWVSSTNSTGSGMGYFQMLSAQTLQCCYFQLALLNAGELQGESKPPGNMECQHPLSQQRNAWHTCGARGKLCYSALRQLSVITNTTSFPCSALLSKLNRKGITPLLPSKKGLVLFK